MKKKIKYGIIFMFILTLGIISINIYQPDKEPVLKGKIEIIAYDNTYDYLVKCADKFMKLNDKTNVTVKKIYKKDEISQEIDNSSKVTYIAQINRIDYDDLGLEKANHLEVQQDIINSYLKNFSEYRLQQIEYEDISIGVPFTSRPLALYIREDMLNEYGYERDEINTWDDIIRIGKDIYERSNKQIRIINATGQDYCDLVSLLKMQYMKNDTDDETVKSQVSNMLSELENNNILNLNDGGEFLARISSNNALKEITAIEVQCEWSIGNVPSLFHGTNKFFASNGDNLVVFNNIEENKKLVEKFITYVMTNNSDAVEYVLQGDFFSSYLYTYKNKNIEFMPQNFVGVSPLVVLNNIEEKSLLINNYQQYINIKKSMLNLE